MPTKQFALSALALAIGSIALPAAAQTSGDNQLEEVIVLSKRTTYANADVDVEMLERITPISSPLASVATLPGVLVNEGDQYGGDDWSTFISMRGFTTNLDEQQIGMTIDGIPNGNSNYGGGSKANRFIDTPNLRTVAVSQGTADISSRSNEALGGTLNFITDNPRDESNLRVIGTLGDNDAQKIYVRMDTGSFLQDTTTAYVSLSSSTNKTWIEESGGAERQHLAGKFVTALDQVEIIGYLSYDDTEEDNYQRVSLAEFEADSGWDRLTGDWSGIPHIDQVYRRGWSTLRENTLAYLKFNFGTGPVDWRLNTYWHDNQGRGDWLPPYVVDVTADVSGNSELNASPNTVLGGDALGRIFYVDAAGNSLSPRDGCVSSIDFPYGGSGPEGDPACYEPGAIPVGSYRHTHYAKERLGFNADFEWTAEFGSNLTNTLRGGLWIEDYERDESRDWHKIIDSRSSYRFDHVAYWEQYNRSYTVDTMMYYLQDSMDFGMFTATLGYKQFAVELERKDNYTGATSGKIDSDSDGLFSGGIVVDIPAVDGLSLFAGYAENFAAIKDEVLERESSALDSIEPETAENVDIGLRYVGDNIQATLTYYDIEFKNRITFIPPDSPAGIDFLIGTNGTYLNVGGVESDGIELAVTWQIDDNFRLFSSFTDNDSKYLGTGDSALDAEQGVYPGNGVAAAAERMAAISLDWNRDNYRAGLTSRYVDERWLDVANTAKVPDYTVWDLYVGVGREDLPGDFFKSIDIALVVNNLADEDYLGGISGGSAWIGSERNAAVTLRADF